MYRHVCAREKVAKLMAELGPRSLTKADLPSFCDVRHATTIYTMTI